MSTNSNNNDNQEVDLTMISKGIGNFFQNINTSIFKSIQFGLKHKFIIGFLFILGVGLGVYLDTTNKTFDHQIIVQPNFGSTDYLYSKVDLIDSKIKENDTVFLKSIGIEDASKLAKIEIKPIVDVYKFINNSEQNYELLKLLAEDGDVKKIVEEKATSKNYIYHNISFSTKKIISTKKTIEPLLNFLNDNDFYSKIQKEYIANVQLKMKQNDITIAQIDGFLNNFSNAANNPKTNSVVYYNENSPLNDVIETKGKLVNEQGNYRINLVGYDKIIKENSQTINIENNNSVNGKMKLVLPFLFILLFILVQYFISFYKKQLLKSKEQ